MAATAALAEVELALTTCQANVNERQTLTVRERLNTLQDFVELTAKEVTELATKFERRTNADGRIIIPAKVLKNIQALCFWAREKARAGQPLLGAQFTPQVLSDTKETMRLRDETQPEPPSIKPDKLDPSKWTEWKEHALTYFSHMKGVQFAPLDYIVRVDPPPVPLATLPERERALYDYPLTGRHFNDDNKTFFRLLADLLSNTTAYPWIQPYERSQNGRAAWLALVEHYDGGAQKEKRTATALATLKSLHYKNESLFSWEDFSRLLLTAFRHLEGTRDAVTKYNQVKLMLEKIEVDLPRVEVAKAHIRSVHSEDINGAVAYMGTEFSDIFAEAVVYKRSRSRVHAMETARDVRPRLEDGPTRRPDGTFTFYGVDVTDVHRYFTDQEMTDLGPRGQAYVFEKRLEHSKRAARGGGGGRNNPGGRGRGGRGHGGGRGRGGRGRGAGIGALHTADDVSNLTEEQLPPVLPPIPVSPPGTAASTDTTKSKPSTGSQNGSAFGAGAYSRD